MSQPLLFVSAGDPSGDNATSHLIAHLKRNHPDLEFFGLGGPKLKSLAQEQLAASGDLAVLGFLEVARKYSFFRDLLRRSAEEIKRRKPSCVLLVDYPGFNLRLAERIKPLGIPIIYYISPQVWAWGRKRIHQIARLVDRMILILPFEEELFQEHNVPCDMVGHYLLDDIPADYLASPIPESNRLALLPGSRPQEIDRMLAPMLEAARRMHTAYGTTSVVAGIKNGYTYDKHLGEGDADFIRIVYDDSRRVIYESELVLTASGTATLETGIIGRPMVVVYRTGFVTYQIARRLVKLGMIALVNLVLGKRVVPELIQKEAGPRQMFDELSRYKENRRFRDEVKAELDRVPVLLGGHGASERAAGVVEKYL
jgi:lipid-A-disaccharide synthase